MYKWVLGPIFVSGFGSNFWPFPIPTLALVFFSSKLITHGLNTPKPNQEPSNQTTLMSSFR